MSAHLTGRGCKECANELVGDRKRSNTNDFIKKTCAIHGDKYDYCKTIYPNNTHEKITVTCKKHGDFITTPHAILAGYGCQQCTIEEKTNKLRSNTKEFIEKARNIHGDKYDYSLVEYVTADKHAVSIICPIHGIFKQTPTRHLHSTGCPLCAKEIKNSDKKYTTEIFIQKAKEKYGDVYDYSKVNYIDAKHKVTIICPKHGEFDVLPQMFLFRNTCPNCKKSFLELKLMEEFKRLNIEFIPQKQYDWLKTEKGYMSLDFYLPQYNIAIECQGLQHFKIFWWCDEEKLNQTVFRDKLKKQLCDEHGIKLYYFSNLGIEYPYQVYEDLDVLLNIIKNEISIINEN